jgi:hypothetical protein
MTEIVFSYHPIEIQSPIYPDSKEINVIFHVQPNPITRFIYSTGELMQMLLQKA